MDQLMRAFFFWIDSELLVLWGPREGTIKKEGFCAFSCCRHDQQA